MDETPQDPPRSPPRPDPGIRLTAVLVAIAAVVLLGVGGFAVLAGRGASDDDENDGWHGTLQGRATPRPEFTLTDTDGTPYDFAAETEGRLTLLFFGYTSCPDVCPGHMSILSGALDMPGMPQPIVVFVTTDPARDTPERLREWLDNFDEDFVGLTGTVDEIAAAEAAAFVPGSVRATDADGERGDSGDADDYEVGHAAQILAYSPDDLAHVVYPFGTRREDWADDLPRLLQAFS
jgi:protein SCO1/2